MNLLCLFSDYKFRLRMALQRAFRGYDDTATWDLNDYLADIAIPCLEDIKKGCGYPSSCESREVWEDKLQKMIDGFKAYKTSVNSTPTTDEGFKRLDELQEIEKNGLKLFAEHFDSLWD